MSIGTRPRPYFSKNRGIGYPQALEPPSHCSAHLAVLCTVTGSCHFGGLDGVLIAKADGHSIPQIDHADQDREINDLFVAELRLQRLIGVVRRVRVGNAGDRVGPGQRRALPRRVK